MSQPVLEITNLRKSFGSVNVLKDISISMQSGEFLVLLGPSGCGKSTLLNCIAGLEEITSGDMIINGERKNEVPPKDRDIAMVFQSYALYPNMTVAENITFGMKIRHISADKRAAKLQEVASLLQIEPLLARKPSELSGGQRQRVAIGRALVRDPVLFLFDEPLSNLDAKLRVEMRTEIRRLHKALNTSIVYVTHDQIEALTMATKIVVLRDGIVQQIGTPAEVYNTPANTFVAEFMGAPAMNLVPAVATADEDGVKVVIAQDGAEDVAFVDTRPLQDLKPRVPTPVLLGLRPENIRAALPDSGAGQRSEIKMVESVGSDVFVITTLGNTDVTARLDGANTLDVGDAMAFTYDMSTASYFSSDDGTRLT